MIERSIVVQSPAKPCERCGEAIDDLVAAVQAYCENGRDTFMSSYCKGCGARITAETKLTPHNLTTTMQPPTRSEREKATGMKDRELAVGEAPLGTPAVPGWVPIKNAPPSFATKKPLPIKKEKK